MADLTWRTFTYESTRAIIQLLTQVIKNCGAVDRISRVYGANTDNTSIVYQHENTHVIDTSLYTASPIASRTSHISSASSYSHGECYTVVKQRVDRESGYRLEQVSKIRCDFGKIGRTASEEVTLQVINSKCLPVLLYRSEVCPLTVPHLRALDFVVN